ncbi:MAG: metal ABC transporter permease [Candidatus Nitrosomaritimum yanchengensis]
MQRALISGVSIAILCSVVGLFLVLRRYSLFGDAIAHSSFGGIALGLMAGIYPLWTAYGVSLVSALIITRIKDRFNISGDASVAVLLSSGIAVGLVVIGISGGFTIDIFSFLFGSILLVGVNDTILILALTGIILIVVLVLYRQLLYSTFNEEQAKVSGIHVERINYLLVFMAGLTVVTSIQLVGVLLISALFVIPNVTAIMYGKGFKQTALLSMVFSISSVVVGILVSYVFDITPAGTIVLLSIGIFACTMGIKSAGLIKT